MSIPPSGSVIESSLLNKRILTEDGQLDRRYFRELSLVEAQILLVSVLRAAVEGAATVHADLAGVWRSLLINVSQLEWAADYISSKQRKGRDAVDAVKSFRVVSEVLRWLEDCPEGKRADALTSIRDGWLPRLRRYDILRLQPFD